MKRKRYIRKEKVYKLLRVYGGCFGVKKRRRTCKAAKSPGELSRSGDPGVSEWGNL